MCNLTGAFDGVAQERPCSLTSRNYQAFVRSGHGVRCHCVQNSTHC